MSLSFSLEPLQQRFRKSGFFLSKSNKDSLVFCVLLFVQIIHFIEQVTNQNIVYSHVVNFLYNEDENISLFSGDATVPTYSSIAFFQAENTVIQIRTKRKISQSKIIWCPSYHDFIRSFKDSNHLTHRILREQTRIFSYDVRLTSNDQKVIRARVYRATTSSNRCPEE